MIKKYTFTCPSCESPYLQEVMSGTVFTSVDEILVDNEELNLVLDTQPAYIGDPHLLHYQCANCGRVIAETDDSLIDFLKENQG